MHFILLKYIHNIIRYVLQIGATCPIRWRNLPRSPLLSDYKYVREIIDIYPNIEIVYRIYISL